MKEAFPGRFTKTAPAAVELHLTMDLLSGGIDYMAIDTDKESERKWQPYANESCGILNLLDAGILISTMWHKPLKAAGTLSSEPKAILIL